MAQLRLRRFRGSAAAAALLCSLFATLLFASQASAGNYEVRFCTEGVTAAGDKGPFERSGNETVFALTNACGNVNGLRVSHNAGNEGSEGVYGRWLAERPDAISVSSIAYSAQGERSAGYFPQVIGTTVGGDLGIINGEQDLDAAFKQFSVSGDVQRFGVQLICQTGGGACGANPPGQPEAALKNVTYTLTDPTAPSITVTGGTLFEAKAQIGGQSISFTANDAGSGVYRVIAVVNGEDAAIATGDCALGKGFGLGFKPCAGTFTGTLGVDTAAEPWRTGRNKVRVCVEDYSLSRQCTQTTRVLALNGCATNSAPAESLELEWPGKRGVVQSRQGRARRAIASLFGGGRTPLAGGAICFSRGIPGFKDGAERVLECAATTGANGRASVRVRGA